MASRPLFIFGTARSGTNLLAGMLNAHPQVGIMLDPLMPLFRLWRNAALTRAGIEVAPGLPFQDGYFRDQGTAMLDAVLNTDTHHAVPADQLPALTAAVQARMGLEHPELARIMDGWQGDTVDALFRNALKRFADAIPAPQEDRAWCGIKEVWVSDFLPALAHAMPDARFLLIERDPRGVLASLIGLARTDASQAAHLVSYLRHWRKLAVLAQRFSCLPELFGRVHVVSYEELARNPVAVIGQVATFLQLQADTAMLHPQSIDGSARAANTSFSASAPISTQSIEQWRSELSPDELALTDALCGPEMRLSGYAPVSAVHADAPSVRRAWARADLQPGSWRSDSGDFGFDLSHEILRHRLLTQSEPETDTALVRRCFLFNDTYRLLRSIH
jgi:hypothetical protein